MSSTETCEICFARDRETLIRPAVERRFAELVQYIVIQMRELPGAGLSGDDSGLDDVFEEWADQLAFQHSIFFAEYDRLAWQICTQAAEELSDLELSAVAAFGAEFDQHICTTEFIEDGSIDSFNAAQAVANQIYNATCDFAVNYAEDRRLSVDDVEV